MMGNLDQDDMINVVAYLASLSPWCPFTFVKAFAALRSFRRDSSLATWLSRIVLNEALQRRRSRSRNEIADAAIGNIVVLYPPTGHEIDPERSLAQREIVKLLEKTIDQLPQDFRLVLVARTIEGMSTEETAELLGVLPETVKTRLFRARAPRGARQANPSFARRALS
jgi:RNA polymerase sigma-70 factor (ECF subfamily)